MAIQPMADAKFGEPASSAEYNKVTANVRDVDSRLTTVETRTTHATTGNAALGVAVAGLTSVTSHATTGNTALGNRAATLETNHGSRGNHGPIYTEINTLKTQAAANVKPTTATDTLLYGDVISSRPRSECWWGESFGAGYLTMQATRSTKTFSATGLRFCVPSAAVGNGAFEIKLYSSANITTLTERGAWSGTSYVNSTGVKQVTINSLGVIENDYVAIAIVCTGWTTSPKFSSTSTGTG